MKKNWLPIGLCLAFIICWEIFVIRPNMKKELAKREASPTPQQVVDEKNLVPTSTPLLGKNSRPTASPSTKNTLNTEEGPDFERVELSSQRTLQLYSKGSLGAATFLDYRVRGKNRQDNVVVVKDGFRWSSNDPLVQSCLSQLQKSGELKFSAQEDGRSCQIQYESEANVTGLLRAKLTLSGFPESKGWVEFRASDAIGTGPAGEHHTLAFKLDDSKKNVSEKDLLVSDSSENLRRGKVDWLAWGDKYFVALLLPSKEAGSFNPNVVYGPSAKDPTKTNFGFQYPVLNKEGRPVEIAFQIYFGPRDADELKKIDPTLVEVVELGFFAAVARAMLWALKALYKIVHNYGLAIILLTVIVRICFWPLNRKVFESGQKMKELQPQIEKLKAKYGKDKSKADQMNRDLMALYRTQKVNPLGSCLPLLAQMPIFLGLYGALNHSLDLYQAPFFGWIHDLSSPDQYYVFPALWTLTLLAYTKITPMTPPTTGDGQAGPDMTKVMLVMNIVFGFLSKDWPAGLTLYLFVSNLVGIVQQLMFKRAAKLQPIQEGV